MNNGAWSYVGPRIYTAGSQTEHHKGKYPTYAGRGPTSSVATGSKVSDLPLTIILALITFSLQAQHKKEIEAFLNAAFDTSS